MSKKIFKCCYNTEARDEKTKKLVLNVMDKKMYVLHISALQFYLKHGLKLKKVHRAVSCAQTDVLRPFIEFSTAKRRLAKTDFEKDLSKLMNNSVYGKTMEKTMENIRNHFDSEPVNTSERFPKWTNSPTCRHKHIVTENFAVEKKITKQ